MGVIRSSEGACFLRCRQGLCSRGSPQGSDPSGGRLCLIRGFHTPLTGCRAPVVNRGAPVSGGAAVLPCRVGAQPVTGGSKTPTTPTRWVLHALAPLISILTIPGCDGFSGREPCPSLGPRRLVDSGTGDDDPRTPDRLRTLGHAGDDRLGLTRRLQHLRRHEQCVADLRLRLGFGGLGFGGVTGAVTSV